MDISSYHNSATNCSKFMCYSSTLPPIHGWWSHKTNNSITRHCNSISYPKLKIHDRIMFEGPFVKITSQLSPRDIKALEPSMSITYSSLFASKRVVCSLCDLKFRPLQWHGKSNQTFLSLSTIHDVSRQSRRTIFLNFSYQFTTIYLIWPY